MKLVLMGRLQEMRMAMVSCLGHSHGLVESGTQISREEQRQSVFSTSFKVVGSWCQLIRHQIHTKFDSYDPVLDFDFGFFCFQLFSVMCESPTKGDVGFLSCVS